MCTHVASHWRDTHTHTLLCTPAVSTHLHSTGTQTIAARGRVCSALSVPSAHALSSQPRLCHGDRAPRFSTALRGPRAPPRPAHRNARTPPTPAVAQTLRRHGGGAKGVCGSTSSVCRGSWRHTGALLSCTSHITQDCCSLYT